MSFREALLFFHSIEHSETYYLVLNNIHLMFEMREVVNNSFDFHQYLSETTA